MSMIWPIRAGRSKFTQQGMAGVMSSGKPIPDISFPLSADALAVKGGYTPTSTRSTTAAFTDYEGVIRMAAINEARFEGGRRVENLCNRSDPSLLTQITYNYNVSIQTGGITARGCVNAIVVKDNSIQRATYFNCPSMAVNRVYLFSAVVKMNDNGVPVPGLSTTDASVDFRAIIDASAAAYINPVVNLGNNEYLVSYYLNVGVSIGSPSAGFIKYTGNSARGFLISGCQIEDITGSAYTLPSEYIPTAGAAASRWFTTKPDGSPIYPVPKLLMEGQSQNKITSKTANPVDVTTLTLSGPCAADVVDDSSELALAGLSAICTSGKVYRLVFTDSGQYVAFAGAPGNLNVHSCSAYCRVSAGGSVEVGLGSSTKITVNSTHYSRVLQAGITPAATTKTLLVYSLGACTVYIVLPQLEELPVVSSVIPNDTGSALTRTADALSWPLSAELQAMLSIDKAWTTSLANQTGAGSTQCDLTDATALFKFSTFDASPYANSGKMVITRDASNRLAWGFLGAVQDATGLVVYKDKDRTVRGFVKEASVGAATAFDVVADCKAEGTVVLDWVPGYSGSAVNFAAATRALLDVFGSGGVGLLYRIEGTDIADSLSSYDGTSGGVAITMDAAKDILHRMTVRFSSVTLTKRLLLIKGSTVTNSSIGGFDGAYALGSTLSIHKSNTWPCKYSNLRFFKRWLQDSEILRL